MEIRAYRNEDLPEMIRIWNRVVEDGVAFPQEEVLDECSASSFFSGQSLTAVAEIDGAIVGLYILHPNNVGRCGHIANASYAVDAELRGHGVGRALVEDSLLRAKELGFGLLQFNAVVATNASARKLYESLGFTELGVIKKGFRMKDGHFEDIVPYYKPLS